MVAFTGALSALHTTRGFNYYNYTAFVFVFVLVMATIVVGMFTAFDITFDYQSGMGRRLMLAVPKRFGIVLGYVIVAFGRGVLAVVVVWAVALIVGMPVRGDAIQIAGLITLALLLNIVAVLYGAGIALRFQSTAAGSLILVPVFMLIFLTPMMTPRSTLSGWVHTAADVNPLTPTLEAGRGLLANSPVSVGLAFGVSGALLAAALVWTLRSMQAAEKKG
jgi:ABC-2 type transport system permease protein